MKHTAEICHFMGTQAHEEFCQVLLTDMHAQADILRNMGA